MSSSSALFELYDPVLDVGLPSFVPLQPIVGDPSPLFSCKFFASYHLIAGLPSRNCFTVPTPSATVEIEYMDRVQEKRL